MSTILIGRGPRRTRRAKSALALAKGVVQRTRKD